MLPMPRAGAYIVSDLSPDRPCRIACERCGRVGTYRRKTLAARFGDMALPDVLIVLAACERRGDYGAASKRNRGRPEAAPAVDLMVGWVFPLGRPARAYLCGPRRVRGGPGVKAARFSGPMMDRRLPGVEDCGTNFARRCFFMGVGEG